MMRHVWLSIPLLAVATAAQPPAAPRNRIIGVVTEIRTGMLSVKTDAGQLYSVVLLPETKYRRVAPGEKDLTKAQPIQAAEVESGDRVLARGPVAEDGKSITAQWLIVMSLSDLAAKQERERAQWQRRGVAGSVVSTDAAAHQIKIRIPSLRGEQFLTVELRENTRLRRYAPDSVRFADAKPSTLAEVKTGDQLRALGDKNADGTALAAEEVVTGSFRTIAATVIAVAPESGEIRVKDLDSGKAATVRVTADSVLRRAPEMPFAGGGPPNGNGNGTGAGRFQEMLQHLPATHLNEVKAGETIIVSSTRGVDPQQITAITVLAGAEGLVAMRRASLARAGNGRGTASGQTMGSWNLGDLSMIPMP